MGHAQYKAPQQQAADSVIKISRKWRRNQRQWAKNAELYGFRFVFIALSFLW